MADAAAGMVAAAPQAQQAMPGPPAVDAAMVARYFPDAFAGSADLPPMWLLLDRGGQVLHAGRHAAASSAALRNYLEGQFPGLRIGAFQSLPVQDAQGRQVTVAVARIAAE
jgi:hypothetical protein